ncbi:GYD domain-containing protein [Natrinema sp. 1APR25-10V2]|uniref:GYD domain-containing protein n=1 Tax=Natrinema sp. 1APR25-10V2 TaxID=2951081 RepID=UPI00287627BC|nr:GYD domain-containing protein [Natrinema sp. 1APR25-10V2]MDS0473647.1 GYD domain-containing protein [Natrinema sp. 1APR25-10V2]
MPTYATLVDLADRDVQNAQELTTIWGEIRTEFEGHNTELVDSYAALGEHDFLITFEAADREAAFKSALTLHRHGLEGKTMEIVDTADFSNLVDEV